MKLICFVAKKNIIIFFYNLITVESSITNFEGNHHFQFIRKGMLLYLITNIIFLLRKLVCYKQGVIVIIS